MSAWFKRFGLHTAAAIGATGIFVAAAAVGASQTRQQPPPAPQTTAALAAPSPRPAFGRTPVRPSPSATPSTSPTTPRVAPERSLVGTISDVLADELDVIGVGGHVWHIVPAAGALVRLNGRATRLDTLAAGDPVVILGQAQAGPGGRFLAHAITARRK